MSYKTSIKYIKVNGNIEPLSIQQFNILKKNYKKNIVYIFDVSNDYKEILNKFLKYHFKFKFNYKKFDQVLDISPYEIELNVESFKKIVPYLRHMILNDENLIKSLVKKCMNQDRFDHTVSVANLSKKLAINLNLDHKKAFLIGMLHDILKQYDKDYLNTFLKHYDPNNLNVSDKIKHGFAAKYFLKDTLNIYSKDITNAVYFHTTGKCNNLYSMIVYVSDKREPLRNINDSIIDISFKNIYKGFKLLKIDVDNYLKSKGIK